MHILFTYSVTMPMAQTYRRKIWQVKNLLILKNKFCISLSGGVMIDPKVLPGLTINGVV